MNERIKELAEQAGAQYGRITPVSLDCDGIERFAKLIVKECIFQACNDFGSSGQFYEGAKYAANQIKEHFGVEE
jgi:hypothetical protein